jgi:hypothetical protein
VVVVIAIFLFSGIVVDVVVDVDVGGLGGSGVSVETLTFLSNDPNAGLLILGR